MVQKVIYDPSNFKITGTLHLFIQAQFLSAKEHSEKKTSRTFIMVQACYGDKIQGDINKKYNVISGS